MVKVLVSDFDGVICDGLGEYFYSSQLVYQKLWGNSIITNEFRFLFDQLRPVIETGWEMPLLLRALVKGRGRAEILINWQSIKEEMIEQIAWEGITVSQMTLLLDQVRLTQIEENLDHWLGLHRFYEGIIEQLKSCLDKKVQVYIITTKEGKFTRLLLEQQGLFLPDYAIFGKEIKQPKYNTLQCIIERENVFPSDVYFIEDRLETLELITQQSSLQELKLFLAQWGYNTEFAHQKAQQNPHITLLPLDEFLSSTFF